MGDVRVLIIADDPLSRAGLAALLSSQPDCEVVGHIAGDEESLAGLEVFQADVILWDLGWNLEDSLGQMADFTTEWPVVSLLADDSQALAVWEAGVKGLLLRSATASVLRATLTAAAHGLITLDPRLSEALLRSTSSTAPESLIEDLTPRESEVLQLLAEGLSNKAIARRLGISDHTVKFHVNAIMTKLAAQSRTEAVVRATRLGLILL